jgi:acyl carrier protein
LSAFCELHGGKTLSLADLRGYLSQLLPHYMLPSELAVVDRMPLTLNGKVAVDALSRTDFGVSSRPDGFRAPRNPTEQALSEMWSELLQVERVGVTDNFFDLGGQSLGATRILSRIRNAFGVRITMREFFDCPTIEGLARLLIQRIMPDQQSTASSSQSSK